MLDASAIWLVPGLEHPAYKRFSAFFETLFKRYQPLDYRRVYLEAGAHALRQAILGEVERLKPDLLLYSQFPNSYAYIAPEFLGALRSRCRVVGIGFDDEMYFEQAKYFYQWCSAVVTTDIGGGDWLRRASIPVYVTPLQSPQVAPLPPVAAEDIHVSFVGDMTKPRRREYLQHLEAHGFRVTDFGFGSRNGPLADEAVLQVYARSKINLNFTATNPPRWLLRQDPQRSNVGQIKSRPFELAALGRFCLCEWASCVEHWFRPNVDIGVFRDADDLVAQVHRYLGDDILRRRICAGARERYSSARAVQALSETFTSILRLPAQLRAPAQFGGPFFLESMGRSRGVAFLHGLRRGAPNRALSEVVASAMRLPYWRGFFGGIADTIAHRMRAT